MLATLPPDPTSTRILWLLIALLGALVIALLAGILKKATGVTTIDAIIFGGGTFAAAATLVIVFMDHAQLL